MSAIEYTRGDDISIANRTIKLGGVAQDITGWSFRLTVSASQSPADTGAQMFSVTGTLTDAPNGVVDFYPTTEQTDLVGLFYFDIEAYDADGHRRTWEMDQIVFRQDITKGEESFVWTPSEEFDDGDVAAIDGSEHFTVFGVYPIRCTYETRDDRRVLRTHMADGDADNYVLRPSGPEFPMLFHETPGFEFRSTVFVDRVQCIIYPSDGAQYQSIYGAVRAHTDPPSFFHHGRLWTGTELQTVSGNFPQPTWSQSGWYELGVRVQEDGSAAVMAIPEGDAESWTEYVHGVWNAGAYPVQWPSVLYWAQTSDGTMASDLWKYKWRRL